MLVKWPKRLVHYSTGLTQTLCAALEATDAPCLQFGCHTNPRTHNTSSPSKQKTPTTIPWGRGNCILTRFNPRGHLRGDGTSNIVKFDHNTTLPKPSNNTIAHLRHPTPPDKHRLTCNTELMKHVLPRLNIPRTPAATSRPLVGDNSTGGGHDRSFSGCCPNLSVTR